jgi:hypothetical protein
MKHIPSLLVVVAAILVCPAAQAKNIFGKRTRANPAERVPQLVVMVKTEPDEDKRASAVKELRDYDPNAFREIIPVLIDVLQHDAKSSVRAEAATTLSKLRPISQEVGWALEEATKDSSIRVRFTARNVLMGYRISGYRSSPRQDMNSAPAQPSSGPLHGLFSIFQSKPDMPVSGMPASTVIHQGGETPPPPLAVEPTSPSPARPLPPPLMPASQPKTTQPVEQGPEIPQG